MDMAKKEKNTPSQPEKGANQSAGEASMLPSASTPAPKAGPKKAPPPSEWAYRAGTTPKTGNGGVSDGLFAPSQPPPSPATQPHASDSTPDTPQNDEYPNDDEIIEFIEERLKLHAEHQLPLETTLEWLRGFLLMHELKMWKLGLKKAYFHIVHGEIELQDTIKELGYRKLISEKDPKLRPAQNSHPRPDVYTEKT